MEYVDYPKCLYAQDGQTMVVDNQEEETAAKEMGWMTAAQYHKYDEPVAPPVVEPPVVVPPVVVPEAPKVVEGEANDSQGSADQSV